MLCGVVAGNCSRRIVAIGFHPSHLVRLEASVGVDGTRTTHRLGVSTVACNHCRGKRHRPSCPSMSCVTRVFRYGVSFLCKASSIVGYSCVIVSHSRSPRLCSLMRALRRGRSVGSEVLTCTQRLGHGRGEKWGGDLFFVWGVSVGAGYSLVSAGFGVVFLSFVVSSHLVLPVYFGVTPLAFFFRDVSCVFFRYRVSESRLSALSSLLRSTTRSPFIPFYRGFVYVFVICALLCRIPWHLHVSFFVVKLVFFRCVVGFFCCGHACFFFHLSHEVSYVSRFIVEFLYCEQVVFSCLCGSLSMGLSSVGWYTAGDPMSTVWLFPARVDVCVGNALVRLFFSRGNDCFNVLSRERGAPRSIGSLLRAF